MLFRLACYVFLFLVLAPRESSGAQEKALVEGELTVVFDEASRPAAEAAARAYPGITAELEEAFGWEADLGPVTLSLMLEEEFKKLVGNSPITAFAVGREGLIVVGLARAETDPSRTGEVLRHEVAHLYLSRHLGEIPRWLDEGLAQWASGGASELLSVGRTTELERAALFGGLLPLSELERFPSGGKRLRLAYEESLSVVEFIVREHGRDGLRRALWRMKEGLSLDEAFRLEVGIGLDGIEKRWRASLAGRHTVLKYLGDNIYTLLFALAALVTLFGFARLILRMRAQKKEEDEEGWG